jgi:hypothetical protein
MTSKTSLLAIIAVLIFAGFTATAPAAAGAGAQATFIKADTTTQGNWKGVYGNDGYVIPDTTTNKVPSYVALTPQNAADWTWTANGAEVRDLQVTWSANTTVRQASCWYTYASLSYTLDVNITDGNAHRFALYALDWDTRGRTETIQALDGTSGAVLNTQNVSNFSNGIYFVWNVTGHVKFVVTTTGGPNGVISGAFFDPATTAAAPATATAKAQFVTTDTTTEGSWIGAYGADGYTVVGTSQKAPSYAVATPQNQGSWIWANSTTDKRAQQLANNTGRIAATWYAPAFSIDVNITDGNTHQVAVYALDWDSQNRAESVRVLDAQTNTVLDSESVFNFTNGMYLVWNVSGHVTISVTSTSGPNAVISGIFFGGKSSITSSTSTSASIPAITPVTTQTQTVTQTSTTSTPPTTPTTPVVVPAPGKLAFSQTSYSFGSVGISGSTSQTFTVGNSGASNVTISNVSVSGAGFNASGVPAGTVLNPGQTITLSVTFAPASTSSVTGGVTFTSNASNSSAAISLSGAGQQIPHSVALSWNASSSSSVVGYDVYRGSVAGGPYALMTSGPVSSTTFTDSTGQAGQTYYYVVTSVGSSNDQSAYSNVVTATIP